MDKEKYSHSKWNIRWRVLNINVSNNFKEFFSPKLCKCKAHPSVSSFQSEMNAYLRYSSVLKRNKINSMESKRSTDPTYQRWIRNTVEYLVFYNFIYFAFKHRVLVMKILVLLILSLTKTYSEQLHE